MILKLCQHYILSKILLRIYASDRTWGAKTERWEREMCVKDLAKGVALVLEAALRNPI